MLYSIKSIALISFLILLAGCNDRQQTADHTQMGEQDPQTQERDAQHDTEYPDFDELVAVLHPTEGNNVYGVVRFTKTDDGVQVEGEVHGLDPNSQHGFHIHEFGDCTADDGTSAGDHFDPHDQPHGGPDDAERHAGDMGNLESDDNGTAEISYTDTVMTFRGAASILGRGVIVHAEEDDLETQPTGDAGDRLSCGVIGVAEQ
jgi:superoxide dismutase, Cu-Zn family